MDYATSSSLQSVIHICFKQIHNIAILWNSILALACLVVNRNGDIVLVSEHYRYMQINGTALNISLLSGMAC